MMMRLHCSAIDCRAAGVRRRSGSVCRSSWLRTVEPTRTHRVGEETFWGVQLIVSVAEEFEQVTARYRRELLAACYQMLGSTHDAEDAVQETMLRAWRTRDRYDASRSSWRTWLHRIATNVCLNALESRQRRPLPSTLVGPSVDPEQALVPSFEGPWLQPMPTALL